MTNSNKVMGDYNITEPCTLIIFGVTGHLSKNKLLPALYHLEESRRLPEKVTIVGLVVEIGAMNNGLKKSSLS